MNPYAKSSVDGGMIKLLLCTSFNCIHIEIFLNLYLVSSINSVPKIPISKVMMLGNFCWYGGVPASGICANIGYICNEGSAAHGLGCLE